MSGQNSKFIFITVIFCITLMGIACNPLENFGAAEEETTSDADEIEIQAVPTVAATNAPEPTLRTEITEPISPISPVSPLGPTGQSDVDTTNNAVQPLAGSQEALAAAINDLSEQTSSPADEIILISIEAVEWNDSSLGCPEEGFMYAQVITPGYKIVLEAQGQQYEYHTDQTTNVVLCQE